MPARPVRRPHQRGDHERTNQAAPPCGSPPWAPYVPLLAALRRITLRATQLEKATCGIAAPWRTHDCAADPAPPAHAPPPGPSTTLDPHRPGNAPIRRQRTRLPRPPALPLRHGPSETPTSTQRKSDAREISGLASVLPREIPDPPRAGRETNGGLHAPRLERGRLPWSEPFRYMANMSPREGGVHRSRNRSTRKWRNSMPAFRRPLMVPPPRADRAPPGVADPITGGLGGTVLRSRSFPSRIGRPPTPERVVGRAGGVQRCLPSSTATAASGWSRSSMHNGGAKPTTRRLSSRPDDSLDPATKSRLHRLLGPFRAGRAACRPSKKEADDPAAADELYDSGVTWLRAQTPTMIISAGATRRTSATASGAISSA